MEVPVIRLGPVSVYLGEKSGKYPDGNQVTVRGADTLVAFDTRRRQPPWRRAAADDSWSARDEATARAAPLPHARVACTRRTSSSEQLEGFARHYGTRRRPGMRTSRARVPLRAAPMRSPTATARPGAWAAGNGSCDPNAGHTSGTEAACRPEACLRARACLLAVLRRRYLQPGAFRHIGGG